MPPVLENVAISSKEVLELPENLQVASLFVVARRVVLFVPAENLSEGERFETTGAELFVAGSVITTESLRLAETFPAASLAQA